jgi:hypothetical protein
MLRTVLRMTTNRTARSEHLTTSDRSRSLRMRGRGFRRPRTKRRQALRITLWTLLVALVAALGVGGWALNRFVIDHVEISDVSSYESSVKADISEVPLATFAVPATDLPQPQVAGADPE